MGHLLLKQEGYQYYQFNHEDKDGEFWSMIGPLATSRAVQAELGGPIFDSPTYVWLVAKKGQEFVGSGALDTARLQKDGLVMLEWMYVMPTHRRKGVYSTLFRLRLELAMSLSAKILRGATRTDYIRKVFKQYRFKPAQERGTWTYYERTL